MPLGKMQKFWAKGGYIKKAYFRPTLYTWGIPPMATRYTRYIEGGVYIPYPPLPTLFMPFMSYSYFMVFCTCFNLYGIPCSKPFP